MKKNLKKISYVLISILFVVLLLGSIQRLTNDDRISLLGLLKKTYFISDGKSTGYSYFTEDLSNGVSAYFIGDDHCYPIQREQTSNLPYQLNQIQNKKSSTFSLVSLCFINFSSTHLVNTLPLLLAKHLSQAHQTYALIQVGFGDVVDSSFDLSQKKIALWKKDTFTEKNLWSLPTFEKDFSLDYLDLTEKSKEDLFLLYRESLEKNEAFEKSHHLSLMPNSIIGIFDLWRSGYFINVVPEPSLFLTLVLMAVAYHDASLDSLTLILKELQKSTVNESAFVKQDQLVMFLKKFLNSFESEDTKRLFEHLKDGPIKDIVLQYIPQRENIMIRYEKNLDESIQILKNKNIKPILLTYAIEKNIFPNSLIRKLAKKNNIQAIDLVEEAKARQQDPRRFLSFFGYLNKDGTNFYSKIISEWINK